MFSKSRVSRRDRNDIKSDKLCNFRPIPGLRSALLERKLSFLENESEQRESLLGEVLKISNVEPSAMSTRIEKLLSQKNERICDLRYELARITKAHDDLLEIFKAKMIKYGIPIEELGPALSVNLRKKVSTTPTTTTSRSGGAKR